MIVVASMNLHIGCRWAVAFPSVCGQMIYVVLVSSLVWYGPAALQRIPRWCYIPFFLLLCQSYFFWYALICLVWCEFYPPLNTLIIYYAGVILFPPVIPSGSEINRFILSLMHSTCFLVAVRLLNFQNFPKMHLPVINNFQQWFMSMYGTRVYLVRPQ